MSPIRAAWIISAKDWTCRARILTGKWPRPRRPGCRCRKGYRVNPVYLPAPHKVACAPFTPRSKRRRVCRTNRGCTKASATASARFFSGFLFSSLLGVPLGILCGTYRFFARLQEPFIEFFRYLPAPAFGALCVAILGIEDAPKIAIIVIGTFFQQVLVIANSVRKVDPALLEAAQTLGASRWRLVSRVVIPASITDIYTDMRILLGWAWTYLIVAEVVGTMSGITLFINQQARYRNFDNVYAAIAMIGIIGLSTDMFLAWLGGVLFPWKRRSRSASLIKRAWFPLLESKKPRPVLRSSFVSKTELPSNPEGPMHVIQ